MQSRIENGTAIDRNDVVRTRGGEAHFEHLVRAHPRVQGDPAPAQAMGVDQRTHFASYLRLCQRFDHEVALPCAVVFGVPVLDRASSANAEMRAESRDPLLACLLDLQQSPAVGMARHRRHLDRLAAKRVGHIHRLSIGEGHAVAEVTDVIDDEALNHGVRR